MYLTVFKFHFYCILVGLFSSELFAGPKAKRSSFDHCISPANNNLGDACNVHNTDCSNFFGGNLNSSPLNCNLNSNDFESPVAFSNNTKTSSSSSSSRKASNHNSSSRVNGNDVITGANGVHRENSKGGGSLISSSYNISPPLVEKSGNNSGSTAISQNNDSSTDSLLLNIASDSNHNLHTQQSLDDLSLNCFQFNARLVLYFVLLFCQFSELFAFSFSKFV